MSKVSREPKRAEEKPAKRYNMRAAPNWESVDPEADETPDRLRIAPALIPEGLTLQWVTDSVRGQPFHQRRAEFEKKGWTPVHSEDFDGQFNGMFMPKNSEGEIKVEGLVLMARPKEMTDKAKRKERMKALEQVAIKEAALKGGDLTNVTLDATHPSAVNSNRISKSYERISIPEE